MSAGWTSSVYSVSGLGEGHCTSTSPCTTGEAQRSRAGTENIKRIGKKRQAQPHDACILGSLVAQFLVMEGRVSLIVGYLHSSLNTNDTMNALSLQKRSE